MEEDSWSFGLSSASSKSNQSTLKSHIDFFIEIDDFDGDEDLSLDFPCPYCSDDFDLLGLCCHIDEEHASESKSGVCPVCATTRIGTNMVGHITAQHVNFIKGHQKSKPHKDEFFSNLSLSRKELQDEPFRSIFGSVSPALTSMKLIDPLLSFLHSTPRHKPYNNSNLASSSEVGSLEEEEEEEEISEQKALERDNSSPPLSDKDQEEKAEGCKFVQGLVWSTIFGDD